MAFGFSPKHEEEFKIDHLSKKDILIIAIDAAKALKWKIGTTTEEGFLAYSAFSMSSWSEEIKVIIEEGRILIKSECTGSQVMDWGKNKRNVQNFKDSFDGLRDKYSPEEIEEKLEVFRADLDPTTEGGVQQSPLAEKENTNGFLGLFTPRDGYFFTPLIVWVNVLVFLIMILTGVHFMSPTSQSLLDWGANFRPMTLDGQLWRLLTSCFLHIGLFHLLMNMYALIYVGVLLEPFMGKTRFLFAYILSGLAGSVASLYWHDFTVSAGASGAIFGMYGVFLALLMSNIIEKAARRTLLTSIGIFVGYNLLNGVKGGIDNAAHIGGLVAGHIIGFAFIPSIKKPDQPKLQNMALAGLAVLILGASVFAIKSIQPNDIAKYDQEIQEFAHLEAEALAIFNSTEIDNDEEYLENINEVGLPNWHASIDLLENMEQYKIPQHIHDRNKVLIEYCELRIKSFETIKKSIEENTEEYQDELIDLNQQLEETISRLDAQVQND